MGSKKRKEKQLRREAASYRKEYQRLLSHYNDALALQRSNERHVREAISTVRTSYQSQGPLKVEDIRTALTEQAEQYVTDYEKLLKKAITLLANPEIQDISISWHTERRNFIYNASKLLVARQEGKKPMNEQPDDAVHPCLATEENIIRQVQQHQQEKPLSTVYDPFVNDVDRVVFTRDMFPELYENEEEQEETPDTVHLCFDGDIKQRQPTTAIHIPEYQEGVSFL